ENGVRGQWWVSRVSPAAAPNGQLEVIGPGGALRGSRGRGTRDFLGSSTARQPEWQRVTLPGPASDGTPHALSAMMRSFAEACRRGKLDGDLDASFHEGLAA